MKLRIAKVSVPRLGASTSCLGLLILLLTLLACASRSPSISEEIAKMLPRDADFRFKAPENWGGNLLEGATLIGTSARESADDIAKIVDGRPATSWTSAGYGYLPEFTFDLGRTVEFNRLVIFNRHTDARGTGGGNNAAEELAIFGSIQATADSFFTISEVTLPGPQGHCIEYEDGRVCFFIDSTDPTIIELPRTRSRFLRIKILSAYWSHSAESEWFSELSYALSEVMVFSAADTSAGQ